jgi:hypothetical protein
MNFLEPEKIGGGIKFFIPGQIHYLSLEIK